MHRYSSFHIDQVSVLDKRLNFQTMLVIAKLLAKRKEYLDREMQARRKLQRMPAGHVSVEAHALDTQALNMAQRAHGIKQALELAWREIFPEDYTPMVGAQKSDLAPLA